MDIDLVQGSPEWKAYRRFKISSTDASAIMGTNPWKSPLWLWKEKLGLVDPAEENEAMRLGTELEPIARDLFNDLYQVETVPIFKQSDKNEWAVASFDGITRSPPIKAVEIKCGKKIFLDAKKGIVKPHYISQVQHLMMVGDLNTITFFSYWEGDYISIEISRDQEMIDRMIEKEFEFWNCLIDLKQPSYPQELLGEEL